MMFSYFNSKDRVFYFIFVLFIFPAASQNLVENASFEEGSYCPYTYQKNPIEEITDSWISPDSGTPDLYHKCSKGDAGVPINWAGIANPVDGDAYIGIYLWKFLSYRENLLTKLSSPLVADSTYNFGCYVKHAAYSEFQSKSIEFGFSNDKITYDKNFETLGSVHTARLKIENPADYGWTYLKGTYKAKGGESFLLIGNVKGLKIDTVKWKYHGALHDEPQLNLASYYYIDSVFVSSKYQKNDKEILFVLNDLNFNFNESKLTSAAKNKLDSLLNKINPVAKKVVIEGYTDDLGPDDYNFNLSKQRAESVKSYLAENGLKAKSRVLALGETHPIVPNISESNRSINRRVVIRVMY